MSTLFDWKLEFLKNTFAKTNKKSYENYVLTAIWHKLNNTDIQPVTQQYVKSKNGSHYFIDLFFPQLHFGIECDEQHHQTELNQKKDKEREADVFDVLFAENISDNNLFRISIKNSFDDLNKQINDCVSAINQKIGEGNFDKWKSPDEKAEKVLKEKRLTTDENVVYRTISQLSKCFGRNYENGTQRGYYKLNDQYQLWCPHLAIKKKGMLMPGTKSDYLNEISKDGEIITEFNINESNHIDHPERERVTFAKSKNVLGEYGYRFVGVYKYSHNDVYGRLVLKRTSKEFNLSIFFNSERKV